MKKTYISRLYKFEIIRGSPMARGQSLYDWCMENGEWGQQLLFEFGDGNRSEQCQIAKNVSVCNSSVYNNARMISKSAVCADMWQ